MKVPPFLVTLLLFVVVVEAFRVRLPPPALRPPAVAAAVTYSSSSRPSFSSSSIYQQRRRTVLYNGPDDGGSSSSSSRGSRESAVMDEAQQEEEEEANLDTTEPRLPCPSATASPPLRRGHRRLSALEVAGCGPRQTISTPTPCRGSIHGAWCAVRLMSSGDAHFAGGLWRMPRTGWWGGCPLLSCGRV